MTVSHWMRKQSRMDDIKADVVIVGAGYAGLSTAYWLTEYKSDLKILIVDRNLSGSGASGRNAGFLTKGSAAFFKSLTDRWGVDHALSILDFADDSIQLVHEHILSRDSEVIFEKASSMTFIRNETQLKGWENFPEIQARFRFNYCPSQELPSELGTCYLAGLESGGEFKVDPVSLLGALRKALLKRNVSFQEHSSAFEIKDGGLHTESNTIEADHFILAMNAYLPRFTPSFEGLIVPKRAQMLAVEVERGFQNSHLNYDPLEKVYWRTTDPKTIIIGGKRLLDEEGENSDFEKISPAIQNGLETYLKDTMKLNFRILKRWSGIMGFTEHELPLIQKVSSSENVWMIGGFSGHGMGFGFKSGKEMAEVLTGMKKETFFEQFRKADIRL